MAMDDKQLIKHSKFWDRAGIFVASLCLVHCLLFPFIILLLPAARQLFANPILEGVILFLGISVGSISFMTTYKKHRKPYPIMIGLTGVALLSLNLFVFAEGEAHTEVLGGFILDPLMIIGGAFLIIGHAWNIHACHCFCDTRCAHGQHGHSH